jgi:hypothetical protein
LRDAARIASRSEMSATGYSEIAASPARKPDTRYGTLTRRDAALSSAARIRSHARNSSAAVQACAKKDRA